MLPVPVHMGTTNDPFQFARSLHFRIWVQNLRSIRMTFFFKVWQSFLKPEVLDLVERRPCLSIAAQNCFSHGCCSDACGCLHNGAVTGQIGSEKLGVC